MRFAIIPEFFVEDIADFILFSAQYVPLIYLFAITVTILHDPEHSHTRYLH